MRQRIDLYLLGIHDPKVFEYQARGASQSIETDEEHAHLKAVLAAL